ncbi:Achaete scute transcription factor [Fasciolopsis buskii]|uniref:Achaete scute transcription factor n=1 Tax=Fasciolopsis buskii TaxID=27845 RepID=A0A8E0VEH5_9TREM|nr:Achaete scute transcription factor [Fasciolopsis buski]
MDRVLSRVANFGHPPRAPNSKLMVVRVKDHVDKENQPPATNEQTKCTTLLTKQAMCTRSTGDPDLLKLDPLCSPTNNRTDSKPKTNSQKTNTIRVSRRNERERNRVRLINLGFERLRAVVPRQSGEQLSKISTLRKAIWYIEHLDRVLHEQSSSSSESNRILPTSTTISGFNTENNCKTVNAESTTGSTRMRLEITSPELSNRRPLSDQRSQRQQRINPAVETGEIVIPTPRQAHQHVDDSRDRMMIDEGSRSETQGAVRMASWSYPDTPTGPCRILGSRGRSVYQRATPTTGHTSTETTFAICPMEHELSPIFPAQWTRNGMEVASTPLAEKKNTQRDDHDSGYSSLEITKSTMMQPLLPKELARTSVKLSYNCDHFDANYMAVVSNSEATIHSPGLSSFSVTASSFPLNSPFGHPG